MQQNSYFPLLWTWRTNATLFGAVSPNEKSYLAECPSGGVCARLPADCIHCSFHHNCTYKKAATFNCRPRKGVHCLVRPVWTRSEECRGGGEALLICCLFPQDESGQPQSNFSLSITCQFCWQLDPSQYRCSNSTNCMTVSCPRRRYNATCVVLQHVHCLGRTSRGSRSQLSGLMGT